MLRAKWIRLKILRGKPRAGSSPALGTKFLPAIAATYSAASLAVGSPARRYRGWLQHPPGYLGVYLPPFWTYLPTLYICRMNALSANCVRIASVGSKPIIGPVLLDTAV